MHAPAAVPMMFAVLLATASVLLLATVSRAELTSLGADEPTPLFNNNTIYVTGKDGRVRSNVKGIDVSHSVLLAISGCIDRGDSHLICYKTNNI